MEKLQKVKDSVSQESNNSNENKYTHILLRVASEVFLKGKNQKIFLKILKRNIKKRIGIPVEQKDRTRIFLPYFEEHQKLRSVFGLRSYSPAIFIPLTQDSKSQKPKEIAWLELLEKVKETAVNLASKKQGTFHIITKRRDKSFPLTSIEVNHTVGELIESTNKNLKFQLKNPEYVLGIEITTKGIFVFIDTIYCPSGLPAGVEGQIALLVEDENTALAGILMLKRGVAVSLLKRKDDLEIDLSLLEEYNPTNLHYFKNIDVFLEEKKDKEKVVVSSQTLKTLKKYSFEEEISKTEESKKKVIVLRPLIAYQDTDELKTKYQEYDFKDNI